MKQRLKISSRGQVTLKKSVLHHLGVQAGDTVTIEAQPNGTIALRRAPTGHISDVFGMLHRPGQRVISIEEMNDIIAKGWAGEL